jgi:uncharacterized membrane protein YuzA (DUF378 family)
MKKLDIVALALVVIGALNWGLVALAEFDLVAALFGMEFGETNAISRIVYALVGLSGVWLAVRAKALVAGTSHAHSGRVTAGTH